MQGLTVKRASYETVQMSSRALIMLKPDTVRKKQICEAMTLLSARLEKNGIKHRFVTPILANVSEKLAETFYKEHVGKDWFEQGFKLFMTGLHPDTGIPRSPIASFILEMMNTPGKDMFKILRSDGIIGPTNPLDVIEKFPERADQVKESIRYILIGKNPIKLIDRIDYPIMNRIHCSADEEAAEKELAAFYLSAFEHILPYYSREAAEFLRNRWEKTGNKYALMGCDFRIPLVSDIWGNYAGPPSDLIQKDSYKNLKEADADDISRQMRRLLPKIIQLEESFFS